MITISNTNFFNVNSGSILRSFDGVFDVILSNISITTSQTIESWIEYRESIGREEDEYYSLFLFGSIGDIIYMEDVNITYLYAHYMEINCELSTGSILGTILSFQTISDANISLDFIRFTYFCDDPIQLIDNQAILNINRLSASNDITDQIINEYTDYIELVVATSYESAHGKDLYIDFLYNDNGESSLIYNHNVGTLIINGLYIYGQGAHVTIISNPDGDATINDMIAIPETYCVNNTNGCEYNADALGIFHWIRWKGSGYVCYGGELKVSNSYLYGCNLIALMLGGGDVYLENITVQMSMAGIWANPDATLSIISSEFRDIGTWYASVYRWLSSYNTEYAPMTITAHETIIKDCVFSYVSPYQFEMWDSTGFFAGLVGDYTSEASSITLINNKFEINDQHVLHEYPSHQTLHYYNNYDPYAGFTNVESVQEMISKYFVVNGAMIIPNNVKVTMINNQFSVNKDNLYVNELILIDYDMPWIYMADGNDTDSTVCMSGNEFSNFAISVKKGNVTSCVRKDMLNYAGASDCQYGTFGPIYETNAIYNQQKPNIFNINYGGLETIIKGEADTFIGLENNIINVADGNVSILTIEGGDYLFEDTFINATDDYHIDTDEGCIINCYSVFKNYTNSIPILDVACSDNAASGDDIVSLDDLYQAESAEALSAYWITVFTESGNSTYFPADKLKLDFSIFDAYGNHIGELGQELIINFASTSDTKSFQVIIDSDGTCISCEAGISFPEISLKDIGSMITFKGSVVDNYLFVDGFINITIIECPSGYGSNTALQCDLCGKGYFNLLPSNNSCHYCDENGDLNGVSCAGADSIIIDYNYWIMVYQYGKNAKQQEGLFANDEYIISVRCPDNYCCSLENGCDFVRDTDNLCARNRDPNEYLCGKCMDGYSEVYGTTNCAECNRNFIERLLFPIIYGLLWTVFIVFTKSKKKSKIYEDLEDGAKKCCQNIHCKNKCCQNESCRNKSCKNKCFTCKLKKNDKDDYGGIKPNDKDDYLSYEEYKDSLEKMVTKVILYFYQSVGYILTTNGIKSSLYGFVELFNLNIFTTLSWGSDNDTNNGFCLFKNMTYPTKLLIQLTSSATIFCFIFSFYLLDRCFTINVCKPLKRKINYPRAFISASLICVGQVLSVLFQLLACRKIGENKTVHYFFGSEECYGGIWIGALISLLLVIILFAVLFVFIKVSLKSSIQKNGKDESVDAQKQLWYHSVVQSYEEKYWFWESILFIRRLLFAFVFIVFDNDNLKSFIVISLGIYLFIHLNYIPFKWNYVNKLDSYLIVCIMIIIYMNSNALNVDEAVYDTIVSSLILFPLIWFTWFLIKNFKSFKNRDKENENENDMDDEVDEEKDGIELAIRDLATRYNQPDTPECHTIKTTSKSNVLNHGDSDSSD